MVPSLDFRECPHCGKSVRSTATECHRCHGALAFPRPRGVSLPVVSADSVESQEHATATFGGYDPEQDDFNYDEFVDREFGGSARQRPWWRYVAWGMVIVMSFPLVLLVLESIFRR